VLRPTVTRKLCLCAFSCCFTSASKFSTSYLERLFGKHVAAMLVRSRPVGLAAVTRAWASEITVADIMSR
jgi:hypothetical protein